MDNGRRLWQSLRMSAFVRVAILLPLLAVAGCFAGPVSAVKDVVAGPTVLDKSPTGIWFREPAIDTGSMAEEASKHCAKFGRVAVYRATMQMAGNYAMPVVVYDCQAPAAGNPS